MDPGPPPLFPHSARPLAKESRPALGVIVFLSPPPLSIMRPVLSWELSPRVDEVCEH